MELGTTTTYYGSYARLYTNKAPILICPNKTDAFTVSDTTHGNASLTNPVGLINADEIAMAGLIYTGIDFNINFYLYTNQDYWTITPLYFSGSSDIIYLTTSGNIFGDKVNKTYGMRPVISLVSADSGSGSGTWNDPYIIN